MSNSLLKQAESFQDYHKNHADLFKQLTEGQAPKTLFISCADSRVDPLLIMGGKPGDLFIIRTAGNIAPVYSKDSGEGASIEFAVGSLPIENIIVCGHSSCGAMKGLLSLDQLGSMPRVKSWVEQSQSILAGLDKGHANLTDHAAKENVKLQLENLKTYPQIKDKLDAGKVKLMGWFFDIQSGQVTEV